jgi:hypothetical protein
MARALRRVVGLVGDVARLDHHDIEFNSLRKIVGGEATPGGGGGGGGSGGGGILDSTFLTVEDETALLDNSLQVAEGAGILFTPVGKQLVISATGVASLAMNILKVSTADSPVAVVNDTTQITYYRGDATAGPIIFNLPPANGGGPIIMFGKEDQTANALVITPSPPDLLNDEAAYNIDTYLSFIWITDVEPNTWRITNIGPMA